MQLYFKRLPNNDDSVFDIGAKTRSMAICLLIHVDALTIDFAFDAEHFFPEIKCILHNLKQINV